MNSFFKPQNCQHHFQHVRKKLKNPSNCDTKATTCAVSKAFSVVNTKSHCCTLGHRDPISGSELACDRDILMKCIFEWFGSIECLGSTGHLDNSSTVPAAAPHRPTDQSKEAFVLQKHVVLEVAAKEVYQLVRFLKREMVAYSCGWVGKLLVCKAGYRLALLSMVRTSTRTGHTYL